MEGAVNIMSNYIIHGKDARHWLSYLLDKVLAGLKHSEETLLPVIKQQKGNTERKVGVSTTGVHVAQGGNEA